MFCWIRADGNLEFRNLRLTYLDTDSEIFDKIEIFLDHDKKEFVRMICDGMEVHGEEASIIAQAIFAIYTHPHVHWWANGAAQLQGKWQTCKLSTDMTQWMNMASTWISWIFIGNTAATMSGIISHDMDQRLPFHMSKLDQKYAENSKAHKISTAVREEMHAKYPSWTDAEINCLIAATVWHSSDHYYTTKYMSWAGESRVMHQDNSLLRQALFAPNTYYLNKLLVSQHLDDPICKLIFSCAVKVDPIFAKNWLYVACAN